MSLVLQQTLRGLCYSTPWSYAVFWKLKERARVVLTWEDGFYDYAKRAPSQGEEVDTELLGLAVAKMSYHVYTYGEGIIGKIAYSGKHQWIFMGASVSTDEKHPVGWENQFMAGIKTIALIAVPQGVVQLGSTRVVQEDLALVNHVRSLFTSLKSIPCAFLSDLMMEGPGGPQFNMSAFQTPPQGPVTPVPQSVPPPAMHPSTSNPNLLHTQAPPQSDSANVAARYPPYQFAPQRPLVPSDSSRGGYPSPKGGSSGTPTRPPFVPQGPWPRPHPGLQMGGYYTQVTPQLVAEGSPYGVPHPYGVPIPSRPPTPSESPAYSNGGMSQGAKRGGGAKPAFSGGQAASEGRSVQKSGEVQRLSQLRGLEGGGSKEVPLQIRQAANLRQESPLVERATGSVVSGEWMGQPRPSTSYLRHSVGSLPDRYLALPMAPQQRKKAAGQVSSRLSGLAPHPIQVQHSQSLSQATNSVLNQRGLLWPGSDTKESSPTGCSTVSNVQPEMQRRQSDTQSEGASTTPQRGQSDSPQITSRLSGGVSSSLTTQTTPAPPVGSNPRLGAGLTNVFTDGPKPTVETVEAYRSQQQEQLERLDKAGLKGSEVYTLWEEIMKENYRVGIALANVSGGAEGTGFEEGNASQAATPTAQVHIGGVQLQPAQAHSAFPHISETHAVSCGATEEIQNMRLSSGTRSPEPLESNSGGVEQAGPQKPEGVLPLASSSALELAEMYRTPRGPLADVSSPRDDVMKRLGPAGLLRMMPTPGLSPPASDAGHSPSHVPLPPEMFKPRSSPPVPRFSEEQNEQASRVPLFRNETIASLPTSSAWALAMKGSGEAAARRRAALSTAEPTNSVQASAASLSMSYSMQANNGATSPTSMAMSAHPAAPDSQRSSTPELEGMTVMSAGAALESQGLGGALAASPERKPLEHAMSAPAGMLADLDVQKQTSSLSKRTKNEAEETSEASGKWGDDSKAGSKRRKQSPVKSFAPHELTSTGRPRPKDRQQIQARLAELRELIPNTEKLPIDGLLERTIRHLNFLWSVTHEQPVKRQVSFPKSKSLSSLLDASNTFTSPRKREAQIPKPGPAPSEPGHRKPAELKAEAPQTAPGSPTNLQNLLEALQAPHVANLEALSDVWARQHMPGATSGGLTYLGGLGVSDFGAAPNLAGSAAPDSRLNLGGLGAPDSRLNLGGLGASNVRSSSMEHLLSLDPIVVEPLKEPQHMLIEVLCKDEGFYAELSGFLHGLGLQVKRSVLQTVPSGQQWARYVVETQKPMDRLEVSTPLRRFVEAKASEAGGSGNQLSFPPLEMDFGAHNWQGLEGVLEHDLNMYLDGPY